MKIPIGYKWKAIDGLHKGETFVVTSVSGDKIECRRKSGDTVYEYDRKFFESYLKRVAKHWIEKNKVYKMKKQRLD